MKSTCLAVLCAMTVSSAALADGFRVTSPELSGPSLGQAQFANVFGCSGANLSPSLSWNGAPEGTRSYAVTFYDMDAPTGSGFWHWVVVDIPAKASGLAAGAGADNDHLPKGAMMTKNDAGGRSFLGACPPGHEKHRYVLTVKALKVEKLPLPDDPSAAMVGFVSNMDVLDTASISIEGSR